MPPHPKGQDMTDHEPTFKELNAQALSTPFVQPGASLEMVAWIDKSGSNKWPARKGGQGRRWDTVVRPTFFACCERLTSLDSFGGEGLMTVTWADRPNEPGYSPEELNLPTVVGDVNPDNFDELWQTIRIGGATWSGPGWDLVLSNYMEEHGQKPLIARPLLAAVGFGDGILEDPEVFRTNLSNLGSMAKVVYGLHGYNNDPAYEMLTEIQTAHPDSLRVLRLVEARDNEGSYEMADAMLTLLGHKIPA
jgi:hypothetical protein